ncbi:MAG: zinc ribbon domain-containing protein [Bacteroidetes bacterium]|nr:MAG: zinc ribbon domain-containing protein [Bacteroidota bacterium]
MIYRYQCHGCGVEFEARRPIEQRNDPLPCPECGVMTGMRVFVAPFVMDRPFTGVYTRGELARMIAPETDEEREVWRKYG